MSLNKSASPFLRRLAIRNFKSIGLCNVELAPLTVLVGRNGAGKSNFLDAPRFVRDSLQDTLDSAIKQRSGMDGVRRYSTGHPRNFAIRLEFSLPDYQTGFYGFEIAAVSRGGFRVKRETLKILDHKGIELAFYSRTEDRVESSIESMPPVLADRLYLVNAAGRPEFRAAFDALTAIGIYNLNPEVIKQLQTPDVGELLHRDGRNIASVISRIAAEQPEQWERICQYLGVIVPGITGVEQKQLGPKETLRFSQEIRGAKHPWKFYAGSMSDGTLRVLGALVAVIQLADHKHPVRLVGIEEPETALHPAATRALYDALREASLRTQVIVTSHSADLLDQITFDREQLLVVEAREGTTYIAQADKASRDAIRDHLFSAGELLRMDQLRPDDDSLNDQRELRLSLSDDSEESGNQGS